MVIATLAVPTPEPARLVTDYERWLGGLRLLDYRAKVEPVTEPPLDVTTAISIDGLRGLFFAHGGKPGEHYVVTVVAEFGRRPPREDTILVETWSPR